MRDGSVSVSVSSELDIARSASTCDLPACDLGTTVAMGRDAEASFFLLPFMLVELSDCLTA